MTLEKMIQLISDISRVPCEEINGDTLLEEELGMDSMDMFRLLTECENVMDASYDRPAFFEIDNVSRLLAFICHEEQTQ